MHFHVCTSIDTRSYRTVVFAENESSTRPRDAVRAGRGCLLQRVGREEPGDARPVNSAPKGEPQLELAWPRLKTQSKIDLQRSEN